MTDLYRTIAHRSESLYKEKGSKFIGLALPINSEEEVKEKLEEIKKQYYDARHHCYAYIIGIEGETYRASDDGEPHHSAGDPILGQIKSQELTNTLVVVVRYFGGTKLGVSGLINAYKTAAFEAITANKIITVEVTEPLIFNFAYAQMNEVMKLVKDFDLNIKEQQFEMDCQLKVEATVKQVPLLQEKVQLLNDLGSSIQLKHVDQN